MRFLGTIEAKVDAKGRAFLPASFRKVLSASGEESLVLRRDIFEACLVLYPQSVWNAQMDEMRSRLSRWDRKEQMVFRMFVSGVIDLGIDGNGRILIPKNFLESAGIGQDIKFVGMGDTIEIWPKGQENKAFMSPEDFGDAIQQLMGQE
jgi:MraZ protein